MAGMLHSHHRSTHKLNFMAKSLCSSRFGKWLICLCPQRNPVMRLLCLPFAGGGASTFQEWPIHLPTSVEVWAVQLPGRGSRFAESPVRNFDIVVAAIGDNLAQLSYWEIPYAIFGHSMGALIGFELCRYLRDKQCISPKYLLVSGRRAPQIADTDPPIYDLPKPDFMERLRDIGGTSPEILENEELMATLLPSLRADFELTQTYRYVPALPLRCNILAFVGTDDEEENSERMEFWREQTIANFRMHTILGNHFFLCTNRRALLSLVTRELIGS